MAETELLFVRNALALKGGTALGTTIEYQVIADAEIIGELIHGPYYLTIWEISDKKSGEERLLCLRVQHASTPADDRPWEGATKSGFYHGGGIADEIVSLASLFLRRRLKLGAVVRLDDIPRLLPKATHQIDGALIQGQTNLAELAPSLAKVEKLQPELHERFMLAVKLYNQALILIESSPDLAYLNLVSAIEILAQDHEIAEPSINDIDKQLSHMIDQIVDDTLREGIRARILARERWIARRFVDFIVANIDDSFWARDGRTERGRIEVGDLPRLMKNVYQQRSRTLHSGEPFPPYVFRNPHMGEEKPMFLGMTVGERKWDKHDFIPYPWFMEILVNHVLKRFLDTHSTDQP